MVHFLLNVEDGATGGTATQVTRNGGFEGAESADGYWLYYTRERGVAVIWRVLLPGAKKLRFLITVRTVTAAFGRYETAVFTLRVARPLCAQLFASSIFPPARSFLFL